MINFDNILKREEERKQKAAVMQQPTEPQPDMNAPMRDTRDNLQSLRQPFQQMVVKANNDPVPTLDRIDPEELRKSQRNNYIQSFDTWADAEKDGTFSQQEWANQRIQRMVAEGKNPGDYLNMLSLLGEAETPAEKAKREKREKLGETFRNLGNLIGSAANLYYTNKGGQYIDLNSVNERHRDRMQRIKDKQDALKQQRDNILINAKLGDLQAERAERIALQKAEKEAKEKELAYQRDLYKLEIQDAFKRGQINAQTKANLLRDANRAKNDKELENLRQVNREKIASINNEASYERAKMRNGGGSGYGSTIRIPIGNSGEVSEFRKSDLTNPIVISQIYNMLPDDYKVKDSSNPEHVKDENGNYLRKYPIKESPSTQQMQEAIGKALAEGYLTEIAPEIEVSGSNKGNKKKSIDGFGEDKKETNKKTISGF